ncbi:MAG: efflux RND transporter periplasmic adaptor subunit [Bacteroidetes bacterium]|nr:efflux RND transporter periplasmic adaptor subunit [Bacteroidota bacterium]
MPGSTHNRWVLLFGFLTVVLLAGCSAEGHHKGPLRLLATRPLKVDTAFVREYVAQVHSINHIELRALERGYLDQIFVDEGQLVPKGQLMFQIKPTIYQAEYQKAIAEVNYAEIEYQNTRALADSHIVSATELALAKAKFEKAKAELALKQAHLDFTEIRAPFDGIMGKFRVRLGSLLDEGELLTTLSDNSRMWVYFNVPEAEYLNYMNRMGKDTTLKVQLRLANNEIFDQIGIVETIEADFNNETGNIAFRAAFSNPKRILRHGETGNILIQTSIRDALIIPQKATFEILNKKYVYVIDAKKRVHARQITIRAEMPNLYVVASGLNPDERILLEGLRKVRDNDLIEYSYKEPRQVLPSLKAYAE